MNTALEVQVAVAMPGLPAEPQLRRWAEAALAEQSRDAELTIRIVDEAEMSVLNQTYRGKHGPTNVLSFPLAAPPGVPVKLLGDVVVCAPIVAREAALQRKSLDAHWAHMLVHGVLHLQGFDHQDEPEAHAMEQREIQILAELGYPDPYGEASPP